SPSTRTSPAGRASERPSGRRACRAWSASYSARRCSRSRATRGRCASTWPVRRASSEGRRPAIHVGPSSMAGDVFTDTNVLVYSRDTAEPEKQRKARAWMTHLWTTRQGRLSYQVLQEFYVTVTEKLEP